MNSIKSVTLFFLLVLSMKTEAQNIDLRLLHSINVNRNKNLDGSFTFTTNSAIPVTLGTPVMMMAMGLIENKKPLFKNGLEMGAAVVANGIITYSLKQTIQRTRPYIAHPEIEEYKTFTDFSFPSGHSSTAFAFAATISMHYPKWYVIAPSYTYAALVGYSRMHLGVHYPSDVLGGIVVGTGSALLTRWLRIKIEKKQHKQTKQIVLY